ncbi:MAG: YitT family protein, partial [Rikenellaceae bacterium]
MKNIFNGIKSYTLITVGLFIYAFAWTGILAPASVMGGGASGVGLLVYHLTGGVEGGVPIGTTFFVFNIILLIIGVLTIGFKFGAKTIFAIFAVSVMLRLG